MVEGDNETLPGRNDTHTHHVPSTKKKVERNVGVRGG